MHVLIIDHGEKSYTDLKDLLLSIGDISATYVATSERQAIQLINRKPIQVVFIRARLWDYRIYAALAKKRSFPAVVFLSRKHDKKTYAFNLQSLHTMQEPFSATGVASTIQKVKQVKATKRDYAFLLIQVDYEYRKVNFDDVISAETTQNYTILITKGETYRIAISLNKLKKKLPTDQFERRNRNLMTRLTADESGGVQRQRLIIKK